LEVVRVVARRAVVFWVSVETLVGRVARVRLAWVTLPFQEVTTG
jgi:hypothetical protein